MRKEHRLIAMGLFMLAVTATPIMATPLNLSLLDFPDVFSDFIDVEYDSVSNFLTAQGFPLTLDDDGVGPAVNIVNGTLDLTAAIDDTGALIQPDPGTLTIMGTVLGHGPVLLTATITAFGFPDGGGDVFEFLFSVTGGDLGIPGLFGGPGTSIGMILNANGSGFTGNFNQSFRNFTAPGAGNGVSDTAPIPEPASILLMVLAGVGLVRRRRQD